MLRRMARAETVDTVAIATSTDPSDDALERFADDLGIPCIRGPLDNVQGEHTGSRAVARAESRQGPRASSGTVERGR